MEAPPLTAPTMAAVAPPQPQSQAAPPHMNYPDSVESSPRSRNTDSWDEPPYGPTFTTNSTAPATKLRLMCSYGGHIFPRPNDKSLCYVGGDTRIVVVDRHSSLSDLHSRLSKTLLNGKSFTLKYQLPNEDLDSLISVTTDEDVENMVDEYDRLHHSSSSGSSNSAIKNSRLRLFLFPATVDSETSSSIESLMENSSKSHDWFVNALNRNSSTSKVRASSDTSSVNCLLGLDDSIENSAVKDEAQLDTSLSMKSAGGSEKPNNNNINGNVAQDVHSVPDSPMLETSSSFGSTSSSPSMANLPPIKVHVEEGNNHKGLVGIGIEESFQHMNIVGAGVGPNNVTKQEDGGFVVASQAAATAGTVVAGLPIMVGGEFQNRVFSDDERSEQGVPLGFIKQLQVQPQQQQQPSQLQQRQQEVLQLQQQHQASQLQQQSKQAGSFDLPSPDSVSSESSVTNPLSRQKPPLMYQESLVQIQPGNSRGLGIQMDPKASDSNGRIQMQQQVQESGYVLPNQFDQYQQLHQPHQYVPAGAQYIHHPPGAVPLYYPMYSSQQLSHQPALEHQYPVYYVPARQTQQYSMPVQQQGFSDSSPTTHSTRPQAPHSAMVPTSAAYGPGTSATATKSEIPAGAYRASAAAPPQLVQVSSGGQSSPQYAGFSQIHHPSQSIAPSAATANYAYEFADPAHAQIYYTQPLNLQLAAQYQTMASSPAVMLPEASSQLPAENVKKVRAPQQ